MNSVEPRATHVHVLYTLGFCSLNSDCIHHGLDRVGSLAEFLYAAWTRRRPSMGAEEFLARDAFVRTNRRVISMMFIRPSVCLSSAVFSDFAAPL